MRLARTATIQARVFPPVKAASEQILWRLGLTMSEAVEIFLRRIIVDERIPFEIVALDVVQLSDLHDTASASVTADPVVVVSDTHPARGAQKENSKSFFRGPTSRSVSDKKRRENGSFR
jgi:addiction module RelB/DinJ family antitoxin